MRSRPNTMMSKLADLKQKKAERDTQLAMRIAVLRDRVHWLVAFYAVMVVVNGVRTKTAPLVPKIDASLGRVVLLLFTHFSLQFYYFLLLFH